MIALDLTGHVVVVTGAGGTIGAGIVARFAAAGATVVRVGRRQQPAVPDGWPVVDIVADLAPPVAAADAAADPADALDVATRVMDEAVAAGGRVDALVNCAGVQDGAALATVPADDWSRMLAVNLTAAHLLTQRFVDHVRGRGGGGSIVHVTSIEATRPALDHGHYGVSKAALRQHARAAAIEFGADGVRVNSIAPGLIERPGIVEQWPDGVRRWEQAAPLGRLGTPADVGDACVFLCSPLASWITGTELVVDGGVSARPGW